MFPTKFRLLFGVKGLTFYAPLTHNLLLTKGQGVATFTRATTVTCWCYLEAAIVGDSQVLQVIPSGIPRFEGARFIASNNTWSNLLADGSVIPEATLKGVKIEVASTNLALQSSNFASATWVKTGTITVTPNAGIAPDGTNNISNVTLSGADSYMYLSGAITSLGVNTISVWLSGTGTVALGGYADTLYYPLITLTSTLTRYSVTVNFAANPSQLWVGVVNGSGATTTDFNIWGYQIEAKPMATSYIPTTIATVTRNADVLTFPNAGNVSDTAGTVLMEVTPAFDIPSGTVAGYGYNFLVEFGGGSGAIDAALHNLRRSDGTTVLSSLVWTPLKNTTYKIGSRYGSAGQRNWLNGTAGTNGAFDGSINSGTNMTIGGYGGGAAYNWGGNIKNLKIYKKALSDTTIIALIT